MTPLSTILFAFLAVGAICALPWAVTRVRHLIDDITTFLDDEEWLP